MRRLAVLLFVSVWVPTGAWAQGTDESPLVLLNHDTGNFFVLASDVPFRVAKARPGIRWFDVETVEGPETEHRTVALTANPAGLRRGVYYSAVRIDVTTATGNETFLVPVALRVGLEHRNAFGRARDIESRVPQAYRRWKPRDPNVELRARTTPGGHFMIEILDKAREQEELRSLAADLAPGRLLATQTYDLVFPWMCLETPCGIPTQTDINDVKPYVHTVSAISYERYAIHGGAWTVLSGVGDPGDWGRESGLQLWPMAVGGYEPTEAQIQSMWAARETVALSMIEAARTRGYAGYCVDVEGHAKGNSKNLFIDLVSHLANRLHDNGLKLMVAHATWSTIAPIEDLAASPVDYVATMDPYTSLWRTYIPNIYQKIDPARLVWGFTWDRVSGDTQRTMWQWMAANGYNDGVAGAAVWRTPMARPSNGVNYYTEGFEPYYPKANDVPQPGCTSTNVPSDRWKGEYFSNPNLQGAPISVRDDGSGSLTFAWGTESPDSSCGVPTDRFSVRWSRQVAFAAGTYRFKASSDDGIRVSVGAQRVFDEWRDQVADFEKDLVISGGNQAVVVEYYENGGGATAKLSWDKIAGVEAPVVVDDPELLVTPTGKMEWWHRETGVGHEGDMVWTQNTATRMDNFARFQPLLPQAGRYKVEAFIPTFAKPSTRARYVIRASGVSHERVSNQELSQNRWMDLGTYGFSATNDGSEYVELGDVTGETNISRNVLFDAVRFTLEATSDGCRETVPPGSWRGEYFNNIGLSGAPALVREEGTGFLKNSWENGGPNTCGLGADLFSARYTKRMSFAAGTYRFRVTADDGVRLFLDGALILDEWRVQAEATFERNASVAAGEHELRVEHYENTGLAVIDVSWDLLMGLVDDPELLVTPTGRMEWWHLETGVGHEGDMVWTQNTLSRRDNYAKWKLSFPGAGWYKVEAFIPDFNIQKATTRARYVIAAKGQTHPPIEINQSASGGKWVSVGTFEFNASNDGSEYAELSDVTGEATISRNVLFDAIRVTPSTPPEPVGGWAYPVGSADSGAGWGVTLGLGQSWTSSSGTQYNGHLAEDWSRSSGSLGQPVYSAADGEVIINLQNCGNYVDVVILKHQVPGITQPIYSMYGHIESNGFVAVGDRVRKRQQIGVIGNPAPFGPHLHFEIKNHTALTNVPFSSCSNTARGIYISAGYSGKRNDYAGGDFWDPSNDVVPGNLYYHPTRFIQQRLRP
jgi:murein DD-endopeptidase MepM/ murein hydrolase activator NlpD